MGIDRQRIVDNFYPPGSEVATHFTPCAIPNGCAGDDWYEFDPAKAKQLLADAGFPNGFDTTLHYRDVVRGYLPDPSVVAQDIQAQLKTNLGINATIDVQESGDLHRQRQRRQARRHPPPRLGRRLPGRHQLPRLPLRRRRVAAVRQAVRRHHDGADDRRRRAPTTPRASRSYTTANNAIKAHVPMVPIAHGGSAVAYRADVQNAALVPARERELRGHDARRPHPVRLHAERRADRPVLRRRDRRRVAPGLRADDRVAATATRSAAPPPIPALATECTPNADADPVDLHPPRRASRSTTARPSTPTTS